MVPKRIPRNISRNISRNMSKKRHHHSCSPPQKKGVPTGTQEGHGPSPHRLQEPPGQREMQRSQQRSEGVAAPREEALAAHQLGGLGNSEQNCEASGTIMKIIIMKYTGWWLGHPSEKYESQLG